MDWHRDIREALDRHGRLAQDSSAHADLAAGAMVDEWAQHAAAVWESARAEGLSVEEARARVLQLVNAWAQGVSGPPRRIARPAAIEPPSNQRSWTGWWQDVRYGWRLLWKQRAYSAVAILTTALAVGATTTLFSVADGVLGRPLAYPAGAALVRLSETREGATRTLPNLFTNITYHTWRGSPDARPKTIEDVAAYRPATLILGGDGSPERLRAVAATPSLFGVLGLVPYRGTFFTEAHVQASGTRVAVLSAELWTRRFARDDAIVGNSITLDSQSYQVVGVLPPGAGFPSPETQIVVPMQVPPAAGPEGANSISLFSGIARLQHGATPKQAGAEATARAKGGPPPGMVDTAVYGSRGARIVTAVSLRESLIGEVRPAILVFLAAVGLLFLTAVANISSMQLARSTARRREIAIRAAIGAGASRITRQLLVESTMLGLLGGAVGMGLAIALHRALPSLLPADFPRVSEIVVNWRVVGMAGGLSMAAGLLFGLLPVWQMRRVRLVDALTEDGQAPAGLSVRTSLGRVRVAVMVAQVAAASLLLVGAGLLGRSFAALWSIDRGYDPLHTVTARVPMPNPQFTPQRRAEVMRALLERLRQRPDVIAAGITSGLPLTNADAMMGFSFAGPDGAQVNVQATSRTVTPGWFEAMGARIVSGRSHTEADTSTSRPVVVINETFARTYLRGEGLGTELPGAEVVGIVGDLHPHARGESPRPEIYFGAWQSKDGVGDTGPILVVRVRDDPAALGPVVRQLAAQIDDRIVLDSVLTMEDRLRTGLARPRLYAVLLGGLAVMALVIAAVGVFGVLSYNVAQRRREIGVRAALGASPRAIVALTVRQGIVTTTVGLVLGLGAAALLVRYMEGLLWGVSRFDPWTFGAVPVLLLFVSVLACWWPARRAASIDPLTALRS